MRYYKFFSAFAAFLLVSLFTFYLLPDYPGYVEAWDENRPHIHQLAFYDRLHEAGWLAHSNVWEYDLNSNQEVTLITTDTHLETLIMVTTTGAREDKIIITEYVNTFLLPRFRSHEISRKNNHTFSISNPGNHYQFYAITKEFTITQFQDKDRNIPTHLYFSALMTRVVIYVQVPQGVLVTNDYTAYITINYSRAYQLANLLD